MIQVHRSALPGNLAGWLARPLAGLGLAWLGQAGFVLRINEAVVLVDPYLSDHLAAKYRGTRFPHARMMDAPVAPDALPRVDLVVCTHRHSDHMDPGTLPVLSACHPGCRFVLPASEQAHAATLGLDTARLVAVDAGQAIRPLPGVDLVLKPLASAHEQLERDEEGRYRFLGFGIESTRVRLYHSGDCIPYPGLFDAVRALAPDLALLPVNGRDAIRSEAGVPGNFTLDEAVALCEATDIPLLVPHHWGMFAFNTIDPATIDVAAARQAATGRGPGLLRPDLRHALLLAPTGGRQAPAGRQEHDVEHG